MAAEHRVCDQKHEKHKRQSDGAEKLHGREGEVFSRGSRGWNLWDGWTERKKKNTLHSLVVAGLLFTLIKKKSTFTSRPAGHYSRVSCGFFRKPEGTCSTTNTGRTFKKRILTWFTYIIKIYLFLLELYHSVNTEQQARKYRKESIQEMIITAK